MDNVKYVRATAGADGADIKEARPGHLGVFTCSRSVSAERYDARMIRS